MRCTYLFTALCKVNIKKTKIHSFAFHRHCFTLACACASDWLSCLASLALLSSHVLCSAVLHPAVFECLSCVNDPSNTQHRKKPSPLTSISPATLLYLLLKVCGVSLKTSAVACTLLCSFSGVPMTVVE